MALFPTLLALLFVGRPAAGQVPLLTYHGNSNGAEFGTALAYAEGIQGKFVPYILVGCPEDDSVGEDAGRVDVYNSGDGSLVRTHYGAATGDRFGTALVGLQDLDGDGHGDYAIGAPFADSHGTDSGQVKVYCGTDGHLIATINGLAAGDRFGSAMGNLGLIKLSPSDPEGLPSLAIGAPYADGPAGADTGAVFFRIADGSLIPGVLPEKRGVQAAEHYGSAIDGRLDALVIGAPDYNGLAGTDSGRYEAWTVYGLGSSGTFEFEVRGTAPNAHLGTAVAIVDWPKPIATLYSVYAAGAPGGTSPYVTIDAINTLLGQPPQSHLTTLVGTGGFGSAVASTGASLGGGSLIAIGAPDFVVGGTSKGRVWIYEYGTFLKAVDGEVTGERFGATIAGQFVYPAVYPYSWDHFLIGAPQSDGTVPDAGRVVQNHVGDLQFELPAPPTFGDAAGSAVAGVGDIDGDGVPDVLVGSPDDDVPASFPIVSERIDCGSARVLSGATGAVLRTHLGGSDGDHLGASVAALGDINLDGTTDYVIGAPQFDNTSTTAGYAIVVSGKTGSTLFTLNGFFNSGEFGAAVGGGSDVNGDGRPDILVGSPGTSNGNVTAYSGINGASLGVVNGANAGDRFGAAVAGLGADLDGDGKQEYVVGAPGFDGLGGADSGRAYLMKSVVSLLTINAASGFHANDHLGTAVAAAGDVNKDGKADYLVGIPEYDSPATDAGRVQLLSGVAGLPTQLATVSGLGANDRFGSSLTALGDVNHDGWLDWAAGARELDPFLPGNGYVRIMSGKDNTQLLLIAGSVSETFGAAIADAGDVDGDGTRDLLVGGPYDNSFGYHSGAAHVVSLATGAPVWTDLGFALAGTPGLPSLVGTGSLVAGTAGALTLSNAKASSLAYVFVALSAAPTPFKGGTLVPIPPLLTLVLGTNASGGLTLPWAAWPAGLSGLDLYFQEAIQDAAAVKGAALSNALRADVP